MNQLYLLRHGESQANLDRIISGSINYDCPLSDNGLAQAEALGKKLADIPFNWVITSRLARAKHTAEAILWHNNFIPEYRVENAELDERSLGTVEGMPRDYVIEKFGKNIHDSWEAQLHSKPPGGETVFAMYQRVIPFFKSQIQPLLANNNVLLVLHYQVMRALVSYIEDEPMTNQFKYNFRNCQLLQYDYS